MTGQLYVHNLDSGCFFTVGLTDQPVSDREFVTVCNCGDGEVVIIEVGEPMKLWKIPSAVPVARFDNFWTKSVSPDPDLQRSQMIPA